MCKTHVITVILTQPHMKDFNNLTHWGLVLPYGIMNLGQYWFGQWLVTYLVPSHYLNQWWHTVNRILWHKLGWNLNENIRIFIQENAFENVCKMSAFLLRPQCVKLSSHSLPGPLDKTVKILQISLAWSLWLTHWLLGEEILNVIFFSNIFSEQYFPYFQWILTPSECPGT